MQIDLNGRVAVVTGGAHGIGRAAAGALAASGASVVVMDEDPAGAERAVAELREQGTRALAVSADVSDPHAVAAASARVAQEFGSVDILVNNAGIGTVRRVPVHEIPLEDWERIVSVDLTGVFIVSRAFIPLMIERGGAAIVNVSSVAGLVPLRLQSAYVAAKAGVANLTRSMAAELGEQGIRVNAVAPGSTLTRGTESLFYGEDAAQRERAASLLAHVPLGRPGQPEEIASAILFLASPAASYVTGAVLPVDGGWIASYHRDW